MIDSSAQLGSPLTSRYRGALSDWWRGQVQREYPEGHPKIAVRRPEIDEGIWKRVAVSLMMPVGKTYT